MGRMKSERKENWEKMKIENVKIIIWKLVSIKFFFKISFILFWKQKQNPPTKQALRLFFFFPVMILSY